MPNKKISELPVAGTLTGTEPLPVVQLGVTVKTTAQDIANLAGGGGGALFIEKTFAEIMALIASNTLQKGAMYKITDKGDGGVILQAIASDALNAEGVMYKKIPKVDLDGSGTNMYFAMTNGSITSIGVWRSVKSVSTGNYCVWGGRVWKNLTGSIGSATSTLTLDSTNWQVQPKTDATVYDTSILYCLFNQESGNFFKIYLNDFFSFQNADYTDDVLGSVNTLDYNDIPHPKVVTVLQLNCVGLFVNNKFYQDETDSSKSNYFVVVNASQITGNESSIVLTNCQQIVDNLEVILSNKDCASIANNQREISGNNNVCAIEDNTETVANNTNIELIRGNSAPVSFCSNISGEIQHNTAEVRCCSNIDGGISNNDYEVSYCSNFSGDIDSIPYPYIKVSAMNLALVATTSFASLPSGLPAGSIMTISDASAISYRGVAAGGGTDVAVVMFDGTNWIYH